jgi:hypothetical protein
MACGGGTGARSLLSLRSPVGDATVCNLGVTTFTGGGGVGCGEMPLGRW